MDSENPANYSFQDSEGGQSDGANGDTGFIGNPNCLRREMLLVQGLPNRLMQVHLGDELWKTTCKPMAQFIVQWGIGVLMFFFREACFGGKPHANWVYISLMFIQVAVLLSLAHSLIALGFATIMTSKELCWLVLLSLLWQMMGIIVGVITSTILMANAYLASLT